MNGGTAPTPERRGPTIVEELSLSLGTKHSTMLEARRGGGAIKSFPRSGVKAKYAAAASAAGPTVAALVASTGLQNMTFHCEICDVHVNSETQLKQVCGWKKYQLAINRTKTKQFISAAITSL